MQVRREEIARMIDHGLLGPKLTDEELRSRCELARRVGAAGVCVKPYAVLLAAKVLQGSGVRAGVDFAKTSTGFGDSGAKVEDVVLMRRHCPERVAIKAAGGIRSLGYLLDLKNAGATRFGTSATAAILNGIPE